MSFQERKRESIKQYMLEKIRMGDKQYLQKTMENFQVSSTTVKRYIQECLDADILNYCSESDIKYQLWQSVTKISFSLESNLFEDQIFYEKIEPLLQGNSRESLRIWGYTFMEIMNNAIEHSEGKQISCVVKRDYLYTEISILDDGIGIFQNVQKYLEKRMGRSISFQDVFIELFKGKLTTNEENHSGEGIFFTSKILNEFAILSSNAIFSQGIYDRQKLIQSHLVVYYTRLQKIGTMVVMKLENNTTRKIEEVFNMYAPIEEGFVRTCIPIKEVCPYGQPIARSQARRILYRLEEFKYVEFDFTGVDFMGQGFADEVFRVFQNKHPELELIPINACETVMGMVKHVRHNLKTPKKELDTEN